MSNLIIVSGVSSSGKTTYIENNFKDYEIISQDDYMIDIFKLNKPMDFNTTLEFIDYTHNKLLNTNNNFVLDIICTNKDSRKLFLDVIPKNFNVKFIFLTVSLDTQIKRMIERSINGHLSDDVIEGITSAYNHTELPTLEELQQYGFNSVELEIIDNN